MRIIAHRGNICGPEPGRENTLTQIKKCLDLGLDVEIDVRVRNNKLWLGHDSYNKTTNEGFLFDIRENLWIHCKNFEALKFFSEKNDSYNYFWHNKDSYTLTSKLYFWSYPDSKLFSNCICVMPEWNMDINSIKNLKNQNIAGICTDYPSLLLND